MAGNALEQLAKQSGSHDDRMRCGMACMLNTPKRVSSLVNGFPSWLLLEIPSLLLHALSAFMVQRSYLFQLIDFSI